MIQFKLLFVHRLICVLVFSFGISFVVRAEFHRNSFIDVAPPSPWMCRILPDSKLNDVIGPTSATPIPFPLFVSRITKVVSKPRHCSQRIDLENDSATEGISLLQNRALKATFGKQTLVAEQSQVSRPEVNDTFRPAITRLELDRERAPAGQAIKLRLDWRTNVRTDREYQLTLQLIGIGRPADFTAHVSLRPGTSQWVTNGTILGEELTVLIPRDLAPGWRRVLISLTDPKNQHAPIALDNADRHERDYRYCFGEIEILSQDSVAPSDTVVRLPTSDPAKPERPNEEWRMRHRERIADVQNNAARLEVLFIGDSITSGWLDIGKSIWEKEFVPLNSVNIGIAGSQTQHILWQIENGALEGISPRVVVLMIGINNVLASPSHTAEDIARGIAVIVSRLREKLPITKIELIGTFPKDEHPNTADRRKVREINSIIQNLNDGTVVRFSSPGDRLLNADGELSKEISPDGVHLSPAGYLIWAEAMQVILAM